MTAQTEKDGDLSKVRTQLTDALRGIKAVRRSLRFVDSALKAAHGHAELRSDDLHCAHIIDALDELNDEIKVVFDECSPSLA